MTITTKNRAQLKSYFVKNAIPTQGHFADLIDAPLNQSDDGVFKLPNEPLSVVAAPGEQKRALRFYSSYPSAAPDWQVSLSPAQDPADPATVKPGFGVTDGLGNTRVFIDPKSGHLGFGTNTPSERLDVVGNVKANRFVGENSLTLGDYQLAKPVSNVYLWSPPGDRDAWIYLDRADANSNWGIYHRQIDSAIKGLPANSIGFVGGGNSALKAYVSLQDGSAMFAGPLSVDGDGTIRSSLTVLGAATVGTAEQRGQTALRVYGPSKPDTWCGRISAGGDKNAVVLGEYNGTAIVGAHNGPLNAWADLTINPHGGAVGIGVPKPDRMLDVGGEAQFRGSVTVHGSIEVKGQLRAGAQLVNHRPIYGLGGDPPLAYSAGSPGTLLFNQLVYGPFGYAVPPPAPGATRKFRIYAVYSDNMTAEAGVTEVRISLATNWAEDGSGGVHVFKLQRTWGDPNIRRDGYSDFITGNLPGHHGFVRIRTNIDGTVGKLYYLAIQAWDFFS